MRRTAALIALVLAPLAPVAAQSAPTAEAQPLSQCEVIARVNSEVVLACELEWQVRLMFEQRFGPEAVAAMDESPLLMQAKEQLLQNLIISRIEISLLFADFRSKAPQADLGSIRKQLEVPFEESEVPRLMKNVGVEDRAALEERLYELGTSLAERREDFVRTMVARQWLQQAAPPKREVTHEQMLDYYHEHEADYDQPDRARWEELMVRFDKHPSKQQAYAALAQLGNQAYAATQSAAADQPAFGALAERHSDGFTATDGGVFDWTTRGSLAAESVDEALFTLQPGEMSPILEGPIGFHIVRVLERKEAGPTPFREVQADIRKSLQDEVFQAAINQKLTELKKSARIWTKFTGDIGYEQLAELQAGGAQTR